MNITNLPNNLEAERYVLGCVFLEQSLMPPVLEKLTVGDFFSPIHQTVFRAFKNMLQTRTDFNPVTLDHEVRRLAEAGHGVMIEPSRLSELYDGVPRFSSVESFESYIKLVRDLSIQRQLIRFADSIAKQAASSDADPSALVAEMARRASDLQSTAEQLSDLVTGDEAVKRTMDALRDKWSRNGMLGLPTGYPDLDRHLQGLQGGHTYIVAAAPNVGKTTFCLNIVNNWLTTRPEAVGLVVSMEMTVSELVVKLCGIRGHLDTMRINSGALHDDEREILHRVGQEIRSNPIVFLEGFNAVTPNAILAKLERMRSKYGRVDYLVLDYVQLMDADINGTDYQRVTAVSRELKNIAMRFNIPVLIVSQLSRNHDHRANRAYRLSDLRDSGGLGQDASVVLFVEPADYDNESDPQRFIRIAKNRMGAKEIKIPLLFIGNQSRFESLQVAV